MAIYGARNSMWAPWADGAQDTDPTKLPSYGAAKTFGELNKVNDSPNYNEGSLPGDDQIVLHEQHFKDGTVDAESVFLSIEDAATILGASHDSEMGLSHGDDDAPPYIGYGFHTHHLGKGKHYYQVIFYPKLKAHPTAENFETRGDNLTFKADKLSFRWENPACRKYKIKKDFATEDKAKAYLAALFAGTAAVPGLPTAQTAQT